MKKKNIFAIVFGIMVAFFGYKAFAVSLNQTCLPYEAPDMPASEVIILYGDLLFNNNPNAIRANATDDAVYIQFNQNFGNVNISIYNSMGGIVYTTVVNTDVQQMVIIPFASAASGTYTVELTNANGYADGEFNKD